MRVGVISNLVTDAGPQPEPSSVTQLGFQVARETEEDMPLLTPMVRPIAR